MTKFFPRLGDVCEFINGGAWKQTEYVDVGIPVVQVSNMKNGTIDINGLKFLSTTSYDRYRKHTLKDGDLIIATVGSHSTQASAAGRATIVPRSAAGMLLNQNAVAIRSKTKSLEQGYLGLIGHSESFQFYLGTVGQGAANQVRIALSAIKEYRCDLPPLGAQQQIIKIISVYDNLIENNRRRIQLLEQAARLLYKEWFVHLRFPGHEHTKIIDGVPEGWERKYVPEVIDINPTEKVQKGVPIRYVSMAGLSTTGMTVDLAESEVRAKSTSVRYRNGDVLFARITPCLENGKTGFVNFLEADEIACGSTEFIVFRGRLVSPYFTYCLARTHAFRETAIKSMIGSSGRQRVQPACFDEFVVGLPKKTVREQFDNSVSPLFQQIATLMRQSTQLAVARDILLPKLMSGEVAV